MLKKEQKILQKVDVVFLFPERIYFSYNIYLSQYIGCNIGCTEFPEFKLAVQPNSGHAVVFCNLLPNGEVDEKKILLASARKSFATC